MATTRLQESPRFSIISAPSGSLTVPGDSYVLSLASLPSHYAASFSAPSRAIRIFDKTTLQEIMLLPGHNQANTSLRSVTNFAGQSIDAIVTSGRDGIIKLWDGRTNTSSFEILAPNGRAVLCCDVSRDGLTVVAGTELEGEDATLLYWDPRKASAPLRVHNSTHSDDITSVHFPPMEDKNVVLSASSDGLLCISDAAEDDEDEAIMHVGNIGASISQAEWIHSTLSTKCRIWASTDMETFSTWSSELDHLQSLDIRNPSLHSYDRTWVTDYHISCYSNPNSDLGIFVGSNEGDIALLFNRDLSISDSEWYLDKIWTSGHTGVVRSLLLDEANNILVSGGEDSKVVIWSLRAQDGGSSYSSSDDMVF